MPAHTQDLLQALRMELAFLERGGYRTPSTRWRPQFIFEDSPICLNSGDPTRSKPCTDCTLMQFVPPDLRGLKFPLARTAGCSSITITQRYVHPQADAIGRAFSKLSGRHKIGHTQKRWICYQ